MRPVIALTAALTMAVPVSAQTSGGNSEPGSASAASRGGPTELTGVTVEVKRKATAVEGVDVVANWCPKADPARHPASGPPRVVSTYPAEDTVIPPGRAMLSITFDQPMTCAWAIDYQIRGSEPCSLDGLWSVPDRMTMVLQCNFRGKSDYHIKFGGEADGVNFKGLSGLDAPEFDLHFTTDDARPIRTLAERAAADPAARRATVATGYIVCHDDSEDEHARCRHVRPDQAEGAAEP